MLHPRPSVSPRVCPACGTFVDPLRAASVLLSDAGFRYLCGEGCRASFLESERIRIESEPPSPVPEPMLRRDPTPRPMPLPRRPRAAPLPSVPVPWVPLATALLAAVVGLAPGPMPLVVLSSVLTCACATTILIGTFPTHRQVGWLAWALGPAGVVLAATAALLVRVDQPGLLMASVGAALAAAFVAGRAYLDARAIRPVEHVVSQLLAEMPATVRVPVRSSGLLEAPIEVSTSRVRIGEEVLAGEGEVVGVDGVVRAGEAWALLYPAAMTPVLRRVGDPLLAGARIVEGEVLMLVTRADADRALARPLRFAEGGARGQASITRVAHTIAAWGGLAALFGALASIVFTGGAGMGAQLSAAAAVLIAAPLLAVRRAGESPLVAASAVAAARGIVFHDAKALDTAGRATVAALCASGTVTDGAPEVIELQTMDASDPRALIALAAGAQSAAEGHPIALAIQRFADERRVAKESVRRATYLPGRGVTALTPSGDSLVIGNRHLLLDEGVSVAVADEAAAAREASGRSVVFLALGGKVRAFFSLEDGPRAGARAAIQRIFDLRIEAVLLSGDHRGTAEVLARDLDIDNVRAELLPEERGAEVQRLKETGGPVATIGREGRDEGALSAADAPIVLGGAGSAAGERAIALATDDLRDAAAALWIARAARGEATRSLLIALFFGGLTVAAAAIGLAAPAVTALLVLIIDAFALPSGERLLRRIELRLPARA